MGVDKDWIGQALSGGRYRVDAKLGEGGMGFVYRAWDTNLGTDVVVKAPRPSMLAEPGFAERFALEIRSLVRLTHPNIVKISDVGSLEGLPFAVMQYLAGGSLEGRISIGRDGRPKPSPADSLRSWISGVASALDFIHQKGYIHRDVKPGNILFDIHGHPYLSDFGVAKVVSGGEDPASRRGMTAAGGMLGTPEYMAPEIMKGHFDGRVDQYALAATVYEVLCGRKPFDGETGMAILFRHSTDPPPPMRELSDDPGGIEAVVNRGLAKSADRRFATCSGFAAALMAALDKLAAARPNALLTCPTCGVDIPPPGDFADYLGKRLRCRSCQGPFRFADDGRSLIRLDRETGPASIVTPNSPPTPGRSGTVVLPGQEAGTPRGVGRTVPLGQDAASPKRSKTVAIAPDAETSRGGRTTPLGPGLAPPTGRSGPSGTVMIQGDLSPPGDDEPEVRKPPYAIIGTVAAAAVAALAVLLVVATSSSTKTKPAEIARDDSEFEKTLTRTTVPPDDPMPQATPAPTAILPAPTPDASTRAAQAAEADPSPPRIEKVDQEKLASNDRGDKVPTRPIGRDTSQFPDSSESPDVVEAPPAPRSGNAKDGKGAVTFEKLLADPDAYVGQVIQVDEPILVSSRLLNRPGAYAGLKIRCSGNTYRGSRDTDWPLEIIVPPYQAEKLRDEVYRQQYLQPGVEYPALLKFKVEKSSAVLGSFEGVVQSIEFLVMIDPKPISFRSRLYNKAFYVVEVTDDGIRRGISLNHESWRKVIPGSFLNSLRLGYEKMFKDNRDVAFAQVFAAAAQSQAAMNRFIQQQDAQRQAYLRSIFGR